MDKKEKHEASDIKGVCFDNPDDDVRFAWNLNERAQVAKANSQHKLAEHLYQSAQQLLEKSTGAGLISALIFTGANHADMYLKLGNYVKARKIAKDAATFGKSISRPLDSIEWLAIALALGNWAEASGNLRKSKEAEDCYLEAVRYILEEITELVSIDLLELCVVILGDAAKFLSALGKSEQANTVLLRADAFQQSFRGINVRYVGLVRKGAQVEIGSFDSNTPIVIEA